MHLYVTKLYLKSILYEIYARILGKLWNNMKIDM